MNKSELVSTIANKLECSKGDSELMIDAFFETITETLASGGDIRVVGFGVFYTSIRKANSGHNPKTLESISIPEKRIPRFKPGKQLKDAVSLNVDEVG